MTQVLEKATPQTPVERVFVNLGMTTFRHIEANPEILGGKPCIKGTRISVEFVLELIASGGSIDAIVKAYPYLTKEGVQEAILYPARFSKNEALLQIKRVE